MAGWWEAGQLCETLFSMMGLVIVIAAFEINKVWACSKILSVNHTRASKAHAECCRVGDDVMS
jgi:hypothetical protein